MNTWLKKNFKVSKIIHNEAHFPCPKCQHPNFYFNLKKKVGFCHRASCHYNPTLNDLIELIGNSPEENFGYITSQIEVDKPEKAVYLPRDCIPADEDDDIVSALKTRNISESDIIRYSIKSNLNQIIVPVFSKGRLVQYVGRNINRAHPPTSREFWSNVSRRYSYFPGVSISKYLFNWENLLNEQFLTLVENTFNAIWLNKFRGVTTNFGSRLSGEQIAKIRDSNIKSLVLLWDEGAYVKPPLTLLNMTGIRTKAILIKGQPDDHRIEDLLKMIDIGHQYNYDPSLEIKEDWIL